VHNCGGRFQNAAWADPKLPVSEAAEAVQDRIWSGDLAHENLVLLLDAELHRCRIGFLHHRDHRFYPRAKGPQKNVCKSASACHKRLTSHRMNPQAILTAASVVSESKWRILRRDENRVIGSHVERAESNPGSGMSRTGPERTTKLVLLAAGLVWLLAGPLAAHDIITTKLTYTRDISRIFYAALRLLPRQGLIDTTHDLQECPAVGRRHQRASAFAVDASLGGREGFPRPGSGRRSHRAGDSDRCRVGSGWGARG